MPPAVLREQLKRTFSILLTKVCDSLSHLHHYYCSTHHANILPTLSLSLRSCSRKRELGALVGMVDADGSGTIDGAEFLCFFLKIGREESRRLARLGKRGALRRRLLREVAAQEADEELEMRESAVMARFGPDDEASALRKVSGAAVNYNRNALGPAKLKGFQDSAAMKPDMFARQLFTTFGVKVRHSYYYCCCCYYYYYYY